MKNIILAVGDKQIPAALNDTTAALDFEKRLPFTITCHDYGCDYCGTAAVGRFDPSEIQKGWRNGDISLGGGWFSLLYGGEEHSQSYEQMMIIGHFTDIATVSQLPDTIKLKITLNESS